MLVLTGLPTLFPKLVEARTFSERMFRVVFLQSLPDEDSREAILKPIEATQGAIKLSARSVDTVVEMSAGYPYFIQFICREVYDAFIQRVDKGKKARVPAREIEQKLDTDFFAGRWARATDRQRDLMFVIARLENCDDEFTVQEIVEKSREVPGKPFGSSHTNQILAALGSQGLVFKNRPWEVLVRRSAPGSLHPPATHRENRYAPGPAADVHHLRGGVDEARTIGGNDGRPRSFATTDSGRVGIAADCRRGRTTATS